MRKTVGLSPKVAIPSIAMIVAGVILTGAGLLAHNSAITDAGLGVLGAAGIHLPLGYKADAGAIAHALDEPGNDALLGDALHAAEDLATGVKVAPPA